VAVWRPAAPGHGRINPKQLHAGLSPRDIQVRSGRTWCRPAPWLGTAGTGVIVGARTSRARAIPVRTVGGARSTATSRTCATAAPQRTWCTSGRAIRGDLKNGDVDATSPRHQGGVRARSIGCRQARLTVVLFDSPCSCASIRRVSRGAIAAAHGLMILMFLGSWRSTVTVVILIHCRSCSRSRAARAQLPLNVMTLGGLALAVGVLVDDATVAIENIHRNIGQRTVRAGDHRRRTQIARRRSLTLCICIVFAPIAFVTGAAKSLFVPLALAVVFAMLMSYLLSRTLVPTMVHYLLAREAATGHKPNAFFQRFDRAFEVLRASYGRWLAWALQHRAFVICVCCSSRVRSRQPARFSRRWTRGSSSSTCAAPGTRIRDREASRRSALDPRVIPRTRSTR
jgi:hypothetical protein